MNYGLTGLPSFKVTPQQLPEENDVSLDTLRFDLALVCFEVLMILLQIRHLLNETFAAGYICMVKYNLLLLINAETLAVTANRL
jgi:hypothetical protein